MNNKEKKRLRSIQNLRDFRAKVFMLASQILMETDFDKQVLVDTSFADLTPEQSQALDEEWDHIVDWLHEQAEELIKKVN